MLDLCCAAGAKMAYLAALLGDRGSVTGVDASAMRMDITVQRLKRCGVLRPAAGVRARLYTGPGQDFELPPPEGGERVEELPGFELAADTAEADDPLLLPQRRRRGKRGRRERAAASKRRRAAVEGRLEEARAAWRARPGYDRVLVDAPCTHDASLRHVAKAQEGEGLEAKAFHPDYVAELAHTQAALLWCVPTPSGAHAWALTHSSSLTAVALTPCARAAPSCTRRAASRGRRTRGWCSGCWQRGPWRSWSQRSPQAGTFATAATGRAEGEEEKGRQGPRTLGRRPAVLPTPATARWCRPSREDCLAPSASSRGSAGPAACSSPASPSKSRENRLGHRGSVLSGGCSGVWACARLPLGEDYIRVSARDGGATGGSPPGRGHGHARQR